MTAHVMEVALRSARNHTHCLSEVKPAQVVGWGHESAIFPARETIACRSILA
jgi:hypothetical protein